MKEYICKEVQTENGGYLEIETELIRCIDCHHFAISATLERADGTIKPVGYTCRLRREPVREDGFCSMAVKRPDRWKHYE